MIEKTPCMRMSKEQWEYAKYYLVQFGYTIKSVDPEFLDKGDQNLIVLNFCSFGNVANLYVERKNAPSRYLVTSLDEFLTKAAELKNYTYIKKDLYDINIFYYD